MDNVYKKQLIKHLIGPWLAGFIIIIFTFAPLIYIQNDKTESIITQYKNKHRKLIKQKRQIREFIALYKKTIKAKRDLTELKQLGLFNTPSRAKWVDTLLFYGAGWLLPDINSTLLPSQPYAKHKLLKNSPLSISIKGYTDLDLIYIYHNLKTSITPFIAWQSCTWHYPHKKQNQKPRAQKPSQKELQKQFAQKLLQVLLKTQPALHQQKNKTQTKTMTIQPLYKHISNLLQQQGIQTIQTQCMFNIIHSSPITSKK